MIPATAASAMEAAFSSKVAVDQLKGTFLAEISKLADVALTDLEADGLAMQLATLAASTAIRSDAQTRAEVQQNVAWTVAYYKIKAGSAAANVLTSVVTTAAGVLRFALLGLVPQTGRV